MPVKFQLCILKTGRVFTLFEWLTLYSQAPWGTVESLAPPRPAPESPWPVWEVWTSYLENCANALRQTDRDRQRQTDRQTILFIDIDSHNTTVARHVMSCHATDARHACHGASCRGMSRFVASCRVMSRHVARVVSCRVMSCHVASSRRVISSRVMSRYVAEIKSHTVYNIICNIKLAAYGLSVDIANSCKILFNIYRYDIYTDQWRNFKFWAPLQNFQNGPPYSHKHQLN